MKIYMIIINKIINIKKDGNLNKNKIYLRNQNENILIFKILNFVLKNNPIE